MEFHFRSQLDNLERNDTSSRAKEEDVETTSFCRRTETAAHSRALVVRFKFYFTVISNLIILQKVVVLCGNQCSHTFAPVFEEERFLFGQLAHFRHPGFLSLFERDKNTSNRLSFSVERGDNVLACFFSIV